MILHNIFIKRVWRVINGLDGLQTENAIFTVYFTEGNLTRWADNHWLKKISRI